jgi:hypothetical protein
MKRLLLPLLLIGSAFGLRAQDSLSGLWNAGGAAMLAPMAMEKHPSLQLVRSLVRVNLYNGFAVTSQEYFVSQTGRDSLQAQFRLPQAGAFHSPRLGMVTYLAPDIQVVKADGTTLMPRQDSLVRPGRPAEYWDIFSVPFAPGQSRSITVRTISRTYLARLRADDGSKDGNAFSFLFHDAHNLWNSRTGTGQVLVKLNDLSMNNVRGILPLSGVTGDMRHIQFGFALDIPKDSDNLVVWYEGAPPDFPFTKKVIPLSDTLNLLMDQFPLAEFGRPDFIALNRDNYETGSDSPLGTVLYYIFFIAPWVFLFGFLVFLMRKPRKKNTVDKLPPGTKNDTI